MKIPRKYTILVGMISQDVVPINDHDLGMSLEREDGKIFYQKKLKTALVFGTKPNNDYQFFKSYEDDAALRCLDFRLIIYEYCDGVWVSRFTGKFGLNDGEWDRDNCTFKIKVEPDNLYSCLKDKKNQEVNILDVINKITTTADLSFNYEFDVCIATWPGPNPCPYAGPNPGTWAQFHQDTNFTWNIPSLTTPCQTVQLQLIVNYREFAITSCVGGTPNPPPAGVGWLLETNNCGFNGTAKYVRYPVAGPIGGYNPAIGYGYSDSLTACLPPPVAVYKSIDVSATPDTPDIIGYQECIEYTATIYEPEYYFSVPNNPNSTYVWSIIVGTATGVIVSGGLTNECLVRFGSGGCFPANNVTVRCTETHGNAYVSFKDWVLDIYDPACANVSFPNSVNAPITGPAKVCPNQAGIKYKIPKRPTYFNAPVWAVTADATIISGQGTDEIIVNAGILPFNVNVAFSRQYDFTYTPRHIGTKVVQISKIPVTPDFEGITSLYPSEPGIVYTAVTRPGATYEWKNSSFSLGTGSTFSYAVPPTVDQCLHLKEYTDCGCDFQKIADGGAFGISPCIYWCPTQSTIITYDRNRLFKEVCKYVVAQLGCGTAGVVSDFFEWNPIGDTPGYSPGINYVTATANKLRWLTISQKSDIIDPLSSNAATKGMITFDKLEIIWREVFNAYWFVDSSNRLRVEHISYFQKTVGYFANAGANAKYNKARNKYTYDKTKMPKTERFKWAESLSTDFIGADIWYDSICVNQDSNNNVAERGPNFVTTDLYYIFLFPDDINKVGFVLMCNDFDGVNYSVNVETGLISTLLVANGHLSWANLHYHYHRHNRVLLVGYMNNLITNFFTALRSKKQKDIVIEVCCEEFDPQKYLVNTELGDGVVDEAEISYRDHKVKISLNHL